MSMALTAILLLIPGTAVAAPNAFWTFGFDLPGRSGKPPRFGERRDEQRYAGRSVKLPDPASELARVAVAGQMVELAAQDAPLSSPVIIALEQH